MTHLVFSVYGPYEAGLQEVSELIERNIQSKLDAGYDLVTVVPIQKADRVGTGIDTKTGTMLRGAILVFRERDEVKVVEPATAPAVLVQYNNGPDVLREYEAFCTAMAGTTLPIETFLQEGDFSGTVLDAKAALAKGEVARCTHCGRWCCYGLRGNARARTAVRDELRYHTSGVLMARCLTCFPDGVEELAERDAFYSQLCRLLMEAGIRDLHNVMQPVEEQISKLRFQGRTPQEVVDQVFGGA